MQPKARGGFRQAASTPKALPRGARAHPV